MIIVGPALALLTLWLLGALTLSLADARRGAGLETLVTDFVAGIVALATLGMTTIALGGRIAVTHVYLLLLLLAATSLWRRRAHGHDMVPARRWWRMPSRAIAVDSAATGTGFELTQAPTTPDALTPNALFEHAPTSPTPAPQPTHRHGPPASPQARILLAGSCLLLLLLVISSSQDRLAWDGWAFWTLKARILFFEGTLPATALDPAGAYPYAHPDYPLAIPLLNWWLYRHAGTPDPALASLAGALWFATLPPLTWTALRGRCGESIAALATLGTTAFWPLAFYATGGYADIAIALATLGAVIELDRMRREWRGDAAQSRLQQARRGARIGRGDGQFNSGKGQELPGGEVDPGSEPNSPAEQGMEPVFVTGSAPAAISPAASHTAPATGTITRLALYLTLAALAKNEGLALALIGVTVALASGIRHGEHRARHYVVLALPFLALAPWYLMTRHLGLVPQHLEDAAPAIGDALARIPTVASALARLLLSRAWTPLPFLALAALLATLRHHRLTAPTGWAILAGFSTIVGVVYLTTTLDLDWLLRTTLDRLAGDLVPAFVVLTLWEIWPEHTPPPGANTATPTTIAHHPNNREQQTLKRAPATPE